MYVPLRRWRVREARVVRVAVVDLVVAARPLRADVPVDAVDAPLLPLCDTLDVDRFCCISRFRRSASSSLARWAEADPLLPPVAIVLSVDAAATLFQRVCGENEFRDTTYSSYA